MPHCTMGLIEAMEVVEIIVRSSEEWNPHCYKPFGAYIFIVTPLATSELNFAYSDIMLE